MQCSNWHVSLHYDTICPDVDNNIFHYNMICPAADNSNCLYLWMWASFLTHLGKILADLGKLRQDSVFGKFNFPKPVTQITLVQILQGTLNVGYQNHELMQVWDACDCSSAIRFFVYVTSNVTCFFCVFP